MVLETFLIPHTDLIFRVISGGGAIAKLHFMLLWQVRAIVVKAMAGLGCEVALVL